MYQTAVYWINLQSAQDRPLGEAEYRTATKFEIAEYVGEFPTSCRENIAGQVVGHRTVIESAKRSGRKCETASRFQAIQANNDWLREETIGEYLLKWHPVNGRPLFRQVTSFRSGKRREVVRGRRVLPFLNGLLSLEPEGEAEKLEANVLWNGAGLLRESIHFSLRKLSLNCFSVPS